MTCLNADALHAAHTRRIDSRQEFYEFFTPRNAAKPEIHGGFVMAHWGGDAAAEEKLKNDLSVTVRCIPLDSPEELQKINFIFRLRSGSRRVCPYNKE